MNKLKFILTVLFFVAVSFLSFAQQKNSVIATVGKDKITSEEFIKRYELTPHLNNDEFNSDSTRYDLLYSLIAEDLWSRKAKDLGIDTTGYYKYSMQPIEDLYVRDALFKREIESKIKYSTNDLNKAAKRAEWTLKINIISAGDSSKIFHIYSLLKNGASFDSLLMTSSDSAGQYAPIEINYGSMEDEYVEDTLYNMHVGNFSSPIKTRYGWFIFKLKDRVESLKGAYTKEGSLREEVMRTLKEQKAKVIGRDYIQKLVTKQKIFTDIKLFRSLVNRIIETVKKKQSSDSYYKTHWILLNEYDLRKIMNDYGSDTLNMSFVKFEKKPATLREFLYSLFVDSFVINNPDISFQPIADLLLVHVNYFIRQESLAREGYKQGLENLPGVKNDLNIWEKSILSKMLRNTFYDSLKVSNSEIKDFFNTTYKFEHSIREVNIQEVLNDRLDVMETVLNELKKGKDFGELARLYTQREWTKDKNGEFGYFPVTMYGPIGRAAAKMKIGEVTGPIGTPDGYSVFKLIGKKDVLQDTNITLTDSLKSRIKDILLEKKWNDKIDSYTAGLANEYGITINDNALKSLKLTDVNMFTYRYMGFGGRITAIPYLVPWYEWYHFWKSNSKNVLP
ncbi:MAG: peptidylprolyl isomerase [Ignavibacteriaceae bacterium]